MIHPIRETYPIKNNYNQPHSLNYHLYTPPAPRGAILIVHGMQEHSGRYKTFADFLSKNGYAVLIYDHLGHGHSVRSEKDLGYFQKKRPGDQLVNDAIEMAIHLKSKFPHQPLFILGHSMGSFIVRCLLPEYHNQITGAILVGTGSKIKGAAILKPLFAALNKIAPRQRNHLINNIFTKKNNKKFKNEKGASPTSWLSLDPANRISFEADALTGIPFTNNGFFGLLQVITQATRRQWAHHISPELPLLFVSGKEDPIGDFGHGVEKIVKKLKKEGFHYLTLDLYENRRHEILNEDIKEEVFASIVGWLDARSQSPVPPAKK